MYNNICYICSNLICKSSYKKFIIGLIALLFAIVFTALFYIKHIFINDKLSVIDNNFENFFYNDENIFNIDESVTIKNSENLLSVLKSQNINQQDINNILNLNLLKDKFNKIKSGSKIYFNYIIHSSVTYNNDFIVHNRILNKILIPVDKKNVIEITNSDGIFNAKYVTYPLKKLLIKISSPIKQNLKYTLQQLKIGSKNINAVINAYDIKLKGNIKNCNDITLLMEKFVTEFGDFSHYGNVVYANLTTNKEHHPIYNPSGNTFITADGVNLKRNVLRMPLKQVNISSPYGVRLHPIHGCHKMHAGVDFKAKLGTPIYSASDGIVVKIGTQSGYGNIIKIQHNNNLTTAYAHVKSFAKNLKLGSKVKQGEVIAHVGNTGTATAAHLHYEVILNGKKVNPFSVKIIPNTTISNLQLAQLKKYQNKIHKINTKLSNKQEISL